MNNIFLLSLLVVCSFRVSSSEADGGFFKVPLDTRRGQERDDDRPSRLVDNPNDPDMMKLKSLEDKFFKVAQNTTLTKEFKSFQELLHLIDTDAGKELGRLFLNGILVGIGKEQSNQLLTEFWDEFQFRVSPDLADSLKDYYDFVRGVDFTLIPMTIQMLFQKDHLGNSLAQMPLGQLVDLIQPEADRYGIDIKGFINGILGKDGSKFPELVERYLLKLNITNVFNAFSTSVMDDNEIISEVSNKIDHENSPSQHLNEKKANKILNLFKPFVSKMLKDNKVDLDPDAVIRVITPFVTGGGELLKNVMGNFKGSKDGKGFDFSKLLPLLGMFGAGQGKAKKDGSNEGGGFDMAQLLPLLGMFGSNQGKAKSGSGIDMAQILPLLGGLLGSQQGKTGSEESKEDSGFDMTKLLPLLGMIGSQDKAEGGSNSGKSGFDFGKIAAKLLPLLGNLGSASGKTKDGKRDSADLGNPLAALASAFGGGNDDLSSLMNAASHLLGNSNNIKRKVKSTEGESDEPESKRDVSEILKSEDVKSAFENILDTQKILNSDIFKKIDDLPNLLENINEQFKALGELTAEMAELKNYGNMVENYEGTEVKMKNPSNIESKVVSSDFTRSLKFGDSLRSLLLKAKYDTDSHRNFKITIHKAKLNIHSKVAMYADLRLLSTMLPLLKTKLPEGTSIEAFQNILTFTRQEWYQFLDQLESPEIRKLILESAATPAVTFIQMFQSISAKDIQQNTNVESYLSDMLSWLDITDISLDNFPEILHSLALVITKGFHIPIDLTLLLEPLQGLIMDNIQWYNSRLNHYKQLSDAELKKLVTRSLNDDFVETTLLLKKLYDLTSVPDACLPKAICIIMKIADQEKESHLKKIFLTVGSLGIGLSNVNDDVLMNINVILALLGSEDCDKPFADSCQSPKSSKISQKKPAKSSQKSPKSTEKEMEEPKAETTKDETHDHTEL